MSSPVAVPTHVKALDGVRALAVLAVMLVHAGAPGFSWGGIGVDVFFVLSGFLITTLLLQEHANTGRIDLWAFLLRRARRLLPAYYLYLAVLCGVMLLLPDPGFAEEGGWNVGGYLLALWLHAINFVPQGGIWRHQILTVHLWSLALEQQYYLVWAPTLAAVLRHGRWVAAGTAALAALAALAYGAWPEGLLKDHMLFTRGFLLLVGSAVAAWGMTRPAVAARVAQAAGRWPLGVLLAALVVWGTTLSARPTPGGHDLALVVLSLALGLFIQQLWLGMAPVCVSRFLQRPSWVWMGQVSYGAYIYHEAVRVLVWAVLKPLMVSWPPALGFATRLGLYLALTFVLAGWSHRYWEQRFLRKSTTSRRAA
ncbi:acyltransferase family protein [Ideonella livida]|uniref:Acyltransferase n=1 Tax=Ideonella livida TaxID=2707176 RepID=A0A7C9PJC9_9BURK|nr:acyltransferase [Ideonella livida]NDY92510.1 acyltransferase [Ideonella livida]